MKKKKLKKKLKGFIDRWDVVKPSVCLWDRRSRRNSREPGNLDAQPERKTQGLWL